MISTNRPDPPTPTAGTPQQKRTEESDTRQAIQRHDPDFYKKKRDDEGGFKDPYDDLTDVSVAALRQFLMDLLGRADGQALPPQPEVSRPPDTSPQPTADNSAPPRAAAMAAYQKGAQRSYVPSPVIMPDVPPDQATPTTALDRAASALDRARLVALLRKLDEVMARGVTSLSLERGPDFLATIEQAITRAFEA